jgi:hypothetical protein
MQIAIQEGKHLYIAAPDWSGTSGFGTWAKNLHTVLRRIGLPVVATGVDNTAIAPNSSTFASFFPLPSTALKTLERHFPDQNSSTMMLSHQLHRVFYGPFALNELNIMKKMTSVGASKRKSLLPLMTRSITLVEREGHVDSAARIMSRINLTAKAVQVPLGVDLDEKKSIVSRYNRRRPLLYLKTVSGIRPNETAITLLLDAVGETRVPGVVFRTGGANRFSHPLYASALEDAPYMLAVTTHDNYANFIAEALAYDVPVFLIVHAHYPEYLGPVKQISHFGMVFQLPEEDPWGPATMTELIHNFSTFLANVHAMKPREHAEKLLSMDVAAKQIRSLLCLGRLPGRL